MKTLAIFLLFIIVCQCTYADYLQNDLVHKHVQRIFGGKIKDGLNKFKKAMKTGNAELNVPKLDPLDSDYQEIALNEEVIKGEGKFNDFHIEGLSEFAIKNSDYEFFGSNVVLDLVWSNIKGNTAYDVKATVMDKYPIYGAGNVSFELQNFNFASKIKVSLDLIHTKISIISFSDIKISLEKLNVEITGLFNNEELSHEIGPIISQLAPEMIVDFQKEITEQISALMPSISNKVLEKIDIFKFINI